jgi:hypothetical protein
VVLGPEGLLLAVVRDLQTWHPMDGRDAVMILLKDLGFSNIELAEI